MPWVGGWERIWVSQTDSRFLGGPEPNGLRVSTDGAGESLRMRTDGLAPP